MTSLSDNRDYNQICLIAATDENVFNTFRQSPEYQKILEHVSYDYGLQYARLVTTYPGYQTLIQEVLKNDLFGSPTKYNYEPFGSVSSTTMRYFKVMLELKKYNPNIENYDICEIGCGYGGQARLIGSIYKPKSYRLVDLDNTLLLCKKYLDNYDYKDYIYQNIQTLESKNYDLLISNYAFTELTREMQDIYLEKIIMNSKHGYITYNDINPVEYKSYKQDELLKIIEGSKIIDEEPQTFHSNCVIIW